MFTETFTRQIVIEECYSCGVSFGMTKDFYQQCQDDNTKFFYCPNGHRQHYTISTVQELKDELARKDRTIDSIKGRLQYQKSENVVLEYQRRSEKAKVTKMKNRIANGVCPCCNRSFKNVKRHMDNKHPEFKDIRK